MIGTDVLAPCVTWASVDMQLIMQDDQSLVFPVEGFQPPVPFQFWEIVDNAIIYLCSLKWIHLDKG